MAVKTSPAIWLHVNFILLFNCFHSIIMAHVCLNYKWLQVMILGSLFSCHNTLNQTLERWRICLWEEWLTDWIQRNTSAVLWIHVDFFVPYYLLLFCTFVRSYHNITEGCISRVWLDHSKMFICIFNFLPALVCLSSIKLTSWWQEILLQDFPL